MKVYFRLGMAILLCFTLLISAMIHTGKTRNNPHILTASILDRDAHRENILYDFHTGLTSLYPSQIGLANSRGTRFATCERDTNDRCEELDILDTSGVAMLIYKEDGTWVRDYIWLDNSRLLLMTAQPNRSRISISILDIESQSNEVLQRLSSRDIDSWDVSPDKTQVLLGDWRRPAMIYLLDLQTNTMREIMEIRVNILHWSMDSRYVGFIGSFSEETMRFNIYDVNEQNLVSQSMGCREDFSWVPQYQQFVAIQCLSANSERYIIMNPTGDIELLYEHPITTTTASVTHIETLVDYAPNGEWIAILDATVNQLMLIPLDSKEEQLIFTTLAREIAWSPDSQYLLFRESLGKLNHRMMRWDIGTDSPYEVSRTYKFLPFNINVIDNRTLYYEWHILAVPDNPIRALWYLTEN